MKTRTKALLLALSAVLLVVSTVFATMAYLTSKTGVVKNTFTVGNVTITLDEAKVDEYGVEVTPETRVTENTYKLIPGHVYSKDPTIHVATGSEDCWLFVKVVDDIADIQDATTVEDQMTTNGWTEIEANVWAYEETVSAGENVVVFESFTIKGDAAVADYNGKTITVVGYAVQADGFDTAAQAWAAAPASWN
ncbi:MAG: hypothetical protein IJY97_02990 [Clostridia bacterium]|nr:hypothetical protein [Clostridia bacterium]